MVAGDWGTIPARARHTIVSPAGLERIMPVHTAASIERPDGEGEKFACHQRWHWSSMVRAEPLCRPGMVSSRGGERALPPESSFMLHSSEASPPVRTLRSIPPGPADRVPRTRVSPRSPTRVDLIARWPAMNPSRNSEVPPRMRNGSRCPVFAPSRSNSPAGAGIRRSSGLLDGCRSHAR
jgi:hypothetical protein